MKKILCVVLILLFVLSGCKNQEFSYPTVTITEVDGITYLNFLEEPYIEYLKHIDTPLDDEGMMINYGGEWVSYSSLTTMRMALLNKNFTENQCIQMLYFFPRNESGLYICDPKQLCVPSLPTGTKLKQGVKMNGDAYSFSFKGDMTGTITYYQHRFDEVFGESWENYEDLDSYRLIDKSTENSSDGIEKTIWLLEYDDNGYTIAGKRYIENKKNVTYVLQNGEDSFYIEEVYCENEDKTGFQTEPMNVTIYREGDVNFVLNLDSVPTVEWLSQIKSVRL